MRGSILNVIVTESDPSLAPATAPSISRTSGLFSAQKPASASSLSKIGTSSHFAMARTFFFNCASLRQRLFHFSLVEEPLLRPQLAGENHPHLLSTGSVHPE